jgi:hypothetical protein
VGGNIWFATPMMIMLLKDSKEMDVVDGAARTVSPRYHDTGADGNGREQTRHGYPLGRHHIESTIFDSAREKRLGSLEHLSRKFGIIFSFM